jgi:hypothetical protein
MQKAISNQSGKPVQVESLDRRDAERNKPYSTKPIKVAPVSTDSTATAARAGEKLDREREANRLAQAKREAHQGSDNATPATEFAVRSEG